MSERDRRALVWGGAIASLAWLILRGAPAALGSLRAAEEEAGQRAEFLERAQDRVEDLSTLSDSIDELSAFAEDLPLRLLAGPDSATATADLMRRVRDALAAAPARLQGFEPLVSRGASEALGEVSIVVDMESDFRGLTDVLSILEADPGLQVLSVSVSAPHADEAERAIEILSIEIGVSGWYRPERVGSPQQAATRT